MNFQHTSHSRVGEIFAWLEEIFRFVRYVVPAEVSLPSNVINQWGFKTKETRPCALGGSEMWV